MAGHDATDAGRKACRRDCRRHPLRWPRARARGSTSRRWRRATTCRGRPCVRRSGSSPRPALIEVRPRRSAVVAATTPEQLETMFIAMGELEATCARLSAMRMTPIERRRLQAQHEGMATLARTGDTEGFSEANKVFSLADLRPAPTTPSWPTWRRACAAACSRSARAQFRSAGRLPRSQAEHEGGRRRRRCRRRNRRPRRHAAPREPRRRPRSGASPGSVRLDVTVSAGPANSTRLPSKSRMTKVWGAPRLRPERLKDIGAGRLELPVQRPRCPVPHSP